MLSESPELSVVVTQYPSELLKILVIVPPKGPFTWFHLEELKAGSGKSGNFGGINSATSSSSFSSSLAFSSSSFSSWLFSLSKSSSSEDISTNAGPEESLLEHAEIIKKIKLIRLIYYYFSPFMTILALKNIPCLCILRNTKYK